MIDTQNTLKLFYKISDYDGFETTNSQNRLSDREYLESLEGNYYF